MGRSVLKDQQEQEGGHRHSVIYSPSPSPNPVAPQSKEDPGMAREGRRKDLLMAAGKVMYVVTQKSTWRGLKIFSETHNDPTYR